MIDIDVKNLKKSFEVGHDVLSGLSFEVNAGEHVGILGANGCGKTTLFKLLCGEYTPDEGTVSIHKGRRIGLISQIPVYPEGWTTEDVLREAHGRLRAMAARIEELEGLMAGEATPALLDEYDRLSDDFRRLGGWDMDRERARVANGLDIPEEMRAREFDKLSGGEKTRVNLARLILEDTDILLLDEPTNHLDLRATEWLEDYITHFRGTVLAISHDRYFLDTVAQRCIEIADGRAEFYSGNYSFYAVERQRRFDEQLRKYEKDQPSSSSCKERPLSSTSGPSWATTSCTRGRFPSKSAWRSWKRRKSPKRRRSSAPPSGPASSGRTRCLSPRTLPRALRAGRSSPAWSSRSRAASASR